MKTSILLLAIVLASCTSEAEKQRQAEQAATLARTQEELAALKVQAAATEEARKAQAVKEEEARARQERAKQALLTNPSAFIEPSAAQLSKTGFINIKYELVKVSLMNKSQFAVRAIKGTIQYSGKGGEVAGVEFSSPVSIEAGETKTVSKADATLSSAVVQARATRYSIKVTSVALVNP